MNNNEVVQCRYKERQYPKVIKECLQYLARQGIPLRGNDDGNDNLTQLLLLRGKNHPYIFERSFSKVCGEKCYTHHDLQNELFFIMSNQLLRSKLCDVNISKYFSIMCNEYTDISNKEQLSFCVRWADNDLNAHKDFLVIINYQTSTVTLMWKSLKVL